MASAEGFDIDALTLAEAGEGAALARILPVLPPAPLATLGPGDDAAVLTTPDSRVVVSCDMMIEGPDFGSTGPRCRMLVTKRSRAMPRTLPPWVRSLPGWR